MSIQRFTARAGRVFDELTRSEARELGQECDGVSLEYVVLALSKEHDGIPGRALRSLSVFLEPLRDKARHALAVRDGQLPRHMPHLQRFLAVEGAAREEADRLGSIPVDAEHVALAVIRLDENSGNRTLPQLGINGHAWRIEILRLMELRAVV